MDLSKMARLINEMSKAYKADYRVVLYKDGSCRIEYRNFPTNPVQDPGPWYAGDIFSDPKGLENRIEHFDKLDMVDRLMAQHRERLASLEVTKKKYKDMIEK